MANCIRNLGKIAGAIFICLAFVFTMTPASAAVFTFDLADHPDRAISSADYGIRLDQSNPDQFFSFDAPGGAQLTVDTGLGTAVIQGVVSENDSNGVQQGLWDLSYAFSGFVFGTDGAFTATGGSGSLVEQSLPNTVINLASKTNGSGLAMIFSNEVFRGFDGWNGRGWIVGSGTNDFLFTATPAGPGQNTAVPIPAALPLFLSALGLIGWLNRRRRRAFAVA